MRHEHQTGSVTPFFGHGYALKQDEFVRHLHHDAGAVACLGIGTLGASVNHMLQHLETLFHQPVAFNPFDIDQKPHAARIVFEAGVIQSSRINGCIRHLIYMR